MDVDAAIARALDLARSSPDTRPNPRVGCVLLDASGVVVGEGRHEGPGRSHAEVEALRAAGDRARGATAVVTLEPCNHTGRTGPCAQALIDAGVSRVVFGQSDPNPVAAGGAARLAAAGVEVFGPIAAEEAAAVNPVWTFASTWRRPFVIWKTAATLDGRIAASDGTSRWITGPAARADVHRLRAEIDAVLVGTGTILADDPELTARPDGVPAERQPLRAAMGLRPVPADARVRAGHGFVQLPTRQPEDALEALFSRDVQSVLLEAGPKLASAFLLADLVDEVRWYVAPCLLGAGAGAVDDLGIRSISGARRLRLRELSRVGDDVCIVLAAHGG